MSLGATQEELRSFNAMVEGKLMPSLFFKIFLPFFYPTNKTTTLPSSFSSISFSCK
jgi:hypothetical protein